LLNNISAKNWKIGVKVIACKSVSFFDTQYNKHVMMKRSGKYDRDYLEIPKFTETIILQKKICYPMLLMKKKVSIKL